ncbi:MAG TPA: hypothetical protein PKD26_10365 [Pyrinomonadaceae bacterium]|jgi:hypothetical protein|nr:hypothetical protein [Pyrinomonadaceae bacterium]
MSTTTETNPTKKPNSEHPMLQITRLNHVKINARILDSTDEKLKKYLQFATVQMDTKITNDDVIDYALNLLFERDSAFRGWLKRMA